MVELSQKEKEALAQRADEERGRVEADAQWSREVEAIAEYQAGVITGFCAGYQYPLERMLQLIRESYDENRDVYASIAKTTLDGGDSSSIEDTGLD